MLDLSYILTATVSLTILGIGLSAVGCVIAFRQRGGGSVFDFIRYVFPLKLLNQRSCYQDVGFILLKQLVRPWVAAAFLLFTSAKCAVMTYGVLVLAFGPRVQAAMPIGLFAGLLIAAVLIQDGLRFSAHYLVHRISILWDVHKVHHSAEFLTPLTNHRVHLIEELIQQAATGLSVGPLLAIAAFLTATSVSTTTLLGFDAYMLIDTLSFGMLRHSHIGLSFGRLEHYLMSPRQHHLHHSIDPRHLDKNFGFLLSCWDRIAGTICYSNPKENLSFGISPEEAGDYNSVLKLHLMPYVKMYRRRLPRSEREQPNSIGPSRRGVIAGVDEWVAIPPTPSAFIRCGRSTGVPTPAETVSNLGGEQSP
jgi:sterol desaturase/sphingolipid hydroxylase (fatty acid hydroxylase superfamily)